jgi:D-glutamate cyclase
MPKIIGEYVDRICSTELRPIGNLPRGVAHRLYDAARQKSSDPLSYAMATALTERLTAHDRVLIVTGAGGAPSLPDGEIDGLLGTTAIARCLTLGLGVDVHVLVENRFVEPVHAVLRAGELIPRAPHDEPLAASVRVHETPIEDTEARAFSLRILDALQPAAVIGIEKLAPNAHGIIHGATGNPWHGEHSNPQYLFDEANRQGILTCGIGDAGNEVGFGSIPEVAEIMPEGGLCRCPCRGGMASAVQTDYLISAAISDWGGYGLAAMVAYLLRRPDLTVGADLVERMLRAAVDAGVVCGWFARPVLCDDGVPLPAQRAAATLIETAVHQGLLTHAHSPSH